LICVIEADGMGTSKQEKLYRVSSHQRCIG
jgi:hypothetical protein